MEKMAIETKSKLAVGKFLAQYGGDFPSYEQVKNILFPRLMPIEPNKDFLEKVPWVSFQGVAVTSNILIKFNPQGINSPIVSLPVSHQMIKDWGELEDMFTNLLYADTIQSAESLFPIDIEPVTQILQVEDPHPFYVMTNRQNWCGASTILYTGALSDFYHRINEPFYIIQSSIHENLLIPKSFGISAEHIKDIVLDVNATILKPEEFLSNTVMYYDETDGLRGVL